MRKKNYKLGDNAPISGQYRINGPRGGDTGKEITSIKGNILPPTLKPGMTYTPVDGTKNKSGKM
jgi:hypothetical protein